MTDVPHLALPLTLLPSGGLAVNEQDEIDDVTQCVAVLLGTPAGSRIEIPEFGIPDLTFATELDVSEIEEALAEWEPRATVDLETVIGAGTDDMTARILAGVRLA